MHRLAELPLLAATIALAACSALPTAPALEDDVAAIGELNAQYLAAINAGDRDALAALTTRDHVMLAPNREPIVGKAENDAANARVFTELDIDETWTPVETVVDGDLAFQRGTFTVTATPKNGGDVNRVSGAFLRIYQRQPDGSWRMTRDMFNTDGPP